MKIKKIKTVIKNIGTPKIDQFKTALLITLFIGFSATLNAADYIVDKAVSKVKWEAKKVTGKHNGTISFANGSITANKSKITGGNFVIDMKTIVDEDLTNESYNKKLIGHLSSDDFFSVEKFPESKMEIKKVTLVTGEEYKFNADLTIKGITNPVEFSAKVQLGSDKLKAAGIITVNRTLFGIKYGSGSFFQGLGDKVIYDDFTLAFEVEALKK
jgi:polyisoprenoid-binding protein YceI